ncbi:peptidylprolyl isomerase SurA [Catenovulum sp. SM1970]|uniref:peptidylprolyl isomerase SurA n=1 Tax=Marinifaba aquimaris TaxID=2741323 RepID=UPI001572303B|nr:peptidylprolyl isomerase SurA [Marinifaba aquimaris]NTS77447.1 peptidylprolyl isomerase SurA [Marinifaba aquimaris]
MKIRNKLAIVFALLMTASAQAAELLDKVAVIVDQGVILESEVQSMIQTQKREAEQANQGLPSDKALRTQVIERLILRTLQMQMAQRAGFQVSDAQLEQTLGRIAANQGQTVEQMRNQIEQSGSKYEVFREEIRTEMITTEIRRNAVSRRIYVSPQEIDSLVRLIQEQGSKNEEYHVGHILVSIPPEATATDIEDSKARAEKVLDMLNTGSDFKKVAIAASSGPRALDGGDLGWMNINEMPTLFAEVAAGKKKGDIMGPIRSGAGFHIITLFDVRGRQVVEVQEVNARHILIKPSIILSDDKAKQMLEEFIVDLKVGEGDFEALAKEHSADPGSAARGGELGFADPNVYVPEFRDALKTLDTGEYAGPFKTVHGWHIVQLLEKRTQDATEKMQEDQAYQMIFKRKFTEEAEAWLRQIRESAYIEVL